MERHTYYLVVLLHQWDMIMIIDNNVDALKKINNNEPLFLEEGLEDYIKNANNNLTTDTNIKNVNNHKYLIVTLGTSSEQVEDKSEN